MEVLDRWSGPKTSFARRGKDHLEVLDRWSGPAKFVKLQLSIEVVPLNRRLAYLERRLGAEVGRYREDLRVLLIQLLGDHPFKHRRVTPQIALPLGVVPRKRNFFGISHHQPPEARSRPPGMRPNLAS